MQKKEKRRWLFRKNGTSHQAPLIKAENDDVSALPMRGADQSHHDFAVAVATAQAVAAAAAHAAIQVARLAKPPVDDTSFYPNDRENQAATIIQTAFRRYLVSNEVEKFEFY